MSAKHENKTGRVRGVILRAVRSLAAQQKRFTVDDVMNVHTMKRGNALAVCHRLKRGGELECLVTGLPGRFGSGVFWIPHYRRFGYRSAVFGATKKLRNWRLTNKQLGGKG